MFERFAAQGRVRLLERVDKGPFLEQERIAHQYQVGVGQIHRLPAGDQRLTGRNVPHPDLGPLATRREPAVGGDGAVQSAELCDYRGPDQL